MCKTNNTIMTKVNGLMGLQKFAEELQSQMDAIIIRQRYIIHHFVANCLRGYLALYDSNPLCSTYPGSFEI